MVYAQEELQAIGQILIEKGIFCISDEIYEKIIYDGLKHISMASLGPEIKGLTVVITVVINGVSKSYSMTCWRIGYAAGPREIIQATTNLQDHSTSNPTSISQKAALAALKGPQETLFNMVAEFARRRDYIVEGLNTIEGISCLRPQGVFYVFPEVSPILKKTFGKEMIKDSSHLPRSY